MKKTIIFLVSGLLSFGIMSAQSSDRAVSKGKNIINVYYGVNLLTSFYKNLATTTASDVKVKGVGPIGLVYEHMVTDGIGLGAEISYASTTLTYVDKSTNQSTGTVNNYNWELKFATTRAMFRANFHFAKSEKFDAYFLISAGYRGTTFTVNSNDPSFNKSVYVIPRVLPPYGFKPGLGFRYFFTDNIGINAEIAIGTPVMCGGLTFKF
ncbi:MAG: hypothetical protein H0W61_05735 [Bacteroidetes bacterium]|nr:hypothetical protein [Bacteroidota bacterium]